MLQGLYEEKIPAQIGTLEQIFKGLLNGDLEIDVDMEMYLEQRYSFHRETDLSILTMYVNPWDEIKIFRLKHYLQLICDVIGNVKYCFLTQGEQKILQMVLYDYRDADALERNIQLKFLLQCRDFRGIAMGWMTVENILVLKEKYDEMQAYMDWNITLGDDVLISYPKVKKVLTSYCEYPLHIELEMKNALCNLQGEAVKQAMDDFREYFQIGKVYDPQKIKECYVKFFSVVTSLAQSSGILTNEYEQRKALEDIISARTNKELRMVSDDLLKHMNLEKVESVQNITIKRMLAIIHESYRDGITLNEVAERMNMTPEYLGTLFYKEMGIHFAKYSQQYRVEKAKELLMSTQCKQYEIAQKTGFSTAKYFSKVFRDVTGQLPTEYRRMYK